MTTTNTKHTLGPWTADLNPQPTIWSGPMKVADVRGWGYLTGQGALGIPDDEAERIQNANARLIAAAPDLLEALAAIVARIDGEYDHPALMAALPALSVDTDDDVRAIARAAIANAQEPTP